MAPTKARALWSIAVACSTLLVCVVVYVCYPRPPSACTRVIFQTFSNVSADVARTLSLLCCCCPICPSVPCSSLLPDQNYVFGQPLERAVFLDTSQSSWRLSPLNLNTMPHLNSTPVTTKPHEKGSSHSVSSASVVSDTPSDTPMPSVSSPTHLHGNNTTSFQFKSFSSSQLDGGASALGSPLLVTPDRHLSLNMDAEEPPLQLLQEGSSLHSFDVSAVEEPAPLSPHSERKALLSTSPPMVPAVVQNSIDYLHSKGVWSRGVGRGGCVGG